MGLVTLPRENQVLAGLSGAEFERLRPHIERVTLERGTILFSPGEIARHVYFPVSAIISLICSTPAGESLAVVLTGREGLVGVSLCLGSEVPATRALVQVTGTCYRASAAVLQTEFARGGTLQSLVLKSTLELITQMAQTVVCNRHHKLEQQLCRWLLMTLDRSRGDLIHLTQEAIANLLGVRREGVSNAAGKLESAGLIVTTRGRIRVIDRLGLERQACGCYLRNKPLVSSCGDPPGDAVFGHQPVQRHA
jgi:CRP-like cAMP-binding protein